MSTRKHLWRIFYAFIIVYNFLSGVVAGFQEEYARGAYYVALAVFLSVWRDE